MPKYLNSNVGYLWAELWAKACWNSLTPSMVVGGVLGMSCYGSALIVQASEVYLILTIMSEEVGL